MSCSSRVNTDMYVLKIHQNNMASRRFEIVAVLIHSKCSNPAVISDSEAGVSSPCDYMHCHVISLQWICEEINYSNIGI